jgi:hypothetical protein
MRSPAHSIKRKRRSWFPTCLLAAAEPLIEPAEKGLSELRREFSRPLFILMAMVGVVLLIA